MSGDRELLELAAKAAEMCIGSHIGMHHDYFADENTGKEWDPRKDDGDALRLAVKLGALVGTYAHFSTVDLLSPNERIETTTVWHHETGGDASAATRLAIVRAAAAIGKSIPDLPTSTQEGAQAGSQTGPAVFKPQCNCPVLAWEDCEHTRGAKP